MTTKRVEFIEEYIRTADDDDYHYNDNHGRLIRCRECAFYRPRKALVVERETGYGWCRVTGEDHEDDWYCPNGKPKEGA